MTERIIRSKLNNHFKCRIAQLAQVEERARTSLQNLQIFNQKVNGNEFVKFMPDVLDALFTILVIIIIRDLVIGQRKN